MEYYKDEFVFIADSNVSRRWNFQNLALYRVLREDFGLRYKHGGTMQDLIDRLTTAQDTISQILERL